MFNARLILLLAGAALAAGGWIYYNGGAGERVKQAQAQSKQTEKVRKAHAKVKREAPSGNNKRDAVEWLRQRTIN